MHAALIAKRGQRKGLIRRRLLGSVLAVCCAGGSVSFSAEGAAEGQAGEHSDESASVRAEQVWLAPGIVWGMDFIAPQDLLLTLREGRMQRVDLASGQAQWVQGLPEVETGGQGGLLDVLVDRDFANNQRIYWTYAKSTGLLSNATALASGRLQGNRLSEVRDLLVADNPSNAKLHYGSRLAQDTQGYLFMTLGERYFSRDEAQQLDNHFGKVLRLHTDGRVPADNPFVAVPGARPEVWSYGHRNPQGLAYDAATDTLYLHEHGPQGGDEINIIRAGLNYGWPLITYGEEYGGGAIGEGTHKAGMQQPIKHYVPSIAPSGLAVYRGQAFPQWQGDLFLGALAGRHLNHVRMQAGRPRAERRYFTGQERVRSVRAGLDGQLYFATDGGAVMRLMPWSRLK